MGSHHSNIILLAWDSANLRASDLDELVRAMAAQAFRETTRAWENRIGRPTEDTPESFLTCWSGPVGGRNGDYTAAFHHSGTKVGWHLDNAHDRLAELCERYLPEKHVQVVYLSLWSEYTERAAIYTDTSVRPEIDGSLFGGPLSYTVKSLPNNFPHEKRYTEKEMLRRIESLVQSQSGDKDVRRELLKLFSGGGKG